MKCDTKSSISKLRSLREELCKKQNRWEEAFHIKDAVVEELQSLKELADCPESTKQCISSGIDNLLMLLDPNREDESGEEDE